MSNITWLTCLLQDHVTVREAESGQLIEAGTFLRAWLEGAGDQPRHANDDIYVENPTCHQH